MQIGIDVGATKIESVVLDEKGNESHRERTDCPKDYFQIIKTIKEINKKLEKEFNKELPIGVCHPGIHSPQTGLVKNAPNCYWLEKKPFQNDLRKELGKEVFCENDANCFALAEATLGAAKKYNVVFGVILGTGCGGGITMLKNIHRGSNRIAGEWGHHCLHPGGRDCYCGNKGCVESYISGTALEKEWYDLTGENHTVTDIIEKGLYKKHPEWKENFLKNFGRGLANVIDILDPHAIVLGGGLSKIDFLYTEGRDSVYKETFSKIVRTPILKNKLGDSAGVFGAAMLSDYM